MWLLLLLSFTGFNDADASSISEIRFYPGHQATFAQPNFDDSSWALIKQNTPLEAVPKQAWIRVHFPDDHVPEGVMLSFPANVTAYWNGAPLQPKAYSQSASYKNILPTVTLFTQQVLVLPEATGEPVLALHIQGLEKPGITAAMLPMTLSVLPVDVVEELNFAHRITQKVLTHQYLLAGIFLGFGLLHLLLYLGYPAFRPNLHYAGWAFTGGLTGYGFFEIFKAVDFDSWLTAWRIATPLLSLNMLFAVTLAHALTVGRSKTTPWIAGYMLLISIWSYFQPFVVFEVQGSVVLLAIGEVLRVTWWARKHPDDVPVRGGRILWFGAIPTILGFLFQLAIFNLPLGFQPNFIDGPIIFYSGFPMVVAMSLFLSRHFSRTNRELTEQLVQIADLNRINTEQEVARAHLEAENQRKATELEQARQLQLSLLPKTIPELDGWRVAAYMATATEVGGDYYDVDQTDDRPTLVLGDATGHGLQAGNMVIAAKTLFNAYAHLDNPVEIVKQMNGAFERLAFQNMFMAMTTVKLGTEHVCISMGGMPPMLWYHAVDQRVEELHIKNLPLGVLPTFAFKGASIKPAVGDVLLIMSDGLMERFNPADDMFGMERVIEVFRHNAHKDPEAQIQALVDAGEAWSEGRPHDDDISFMVMQKR